ncbi:MAG: hypothetical protein ACKVOO_03920 [Burkholderiaceae bacterium]
MSSLAKIFSSKRALYYYVQKGIRLVWLRRALGAALAALVPRRKLVPLDAKAQQSLAELVRDGVTFPPWAKLPGSTIAHLVAHLRALPVYALADLRTRSVPLYVQQPEAMAHSRLYHAPADVACIPELVGLANHPQVLALVARYMGATPTIVSMQAWWSIGHADAALHLAQDDMFHRDVDDLRFLKMFMYLTDVGMDNGVHSFVMQSHQSMQLVRRGPISEMQIHQHFAPAAVASYTGEAGTLFIEDTWGIHRQSPATAGLRLAFAVIYNLSGLDPNSPPSPVAPLPQGLDPYINRVVFSAA